MPVTAWVSIAIGAFVALWFLSLLLFGLYDKVTKRPMGSRTEAYFDHMEQGVKVIVALLVAAAFLDVIL